MKHVVEEGNFDGLQLRTRKQFGEFVSDIIKKSKGANVKNTRKGKAYWDDDTGTIVFFDRTTGDKGTAFRPRRGRLHFDSLE